MIYVITEADCVNRVGPARLRRQLLALPCRPEAHPDRRCQLHYHSPDLGCDDALLVQLTRRAATGRGAALC